MPLCSNCGATNPADARFCMRCGALVGDHDLPVRETRKTVTIVFADVSGFTLLAARLDPESLRGVMGRYFDDMRAVLERHDGMVEKFAGDAIMAIFGVPALHEDDALRAVRATLEMKSKLRELNQHLKDRWGVTVQFHAGINTGEVFTTEETDVRSLATGQPVNVAARLQQAAGPGEILIGAATYHLVRDAVDAEVLRPLELKNHPGTVTAYRLRDVATARKAPVAQLDSPLIGRHVELLLLRRSYEETVANRLCRVLTVIGEAGVGKSRLTEELVPTLSGDPFVLSGRCLSYGGGITLWPIVEVIRQAAEITEADAPETVTLKLRSLLGTEPESAMVMERVSAAMGITEGTHGMEQIFWGVRRFLETLARERPLIVVVDDLQWAEPVFLDMVEYLAAFGREAPILVICLARPDLLDTRPSWLAGKTNVGSVVLEPLQAPEGEMLIESLLGGNGISDDARRWIVETANGNPLFVQEILRMMIDEGFLVRSQSGWSFLGDVASLTTPLTIQALLAARLDSLGTDEKAVLQRASVVGQVFWWGAVTELSDKDSRSTVGRSLQGLVRNQFVTPCESSFVEEDAFRFGHILFLDAAYQAMPKEMRADLHERFASWLERKAEARISDYEAIVGYHLEQAYRYRSELALVDERTARLAVRAAAFLIPPARRAYERGDVPGALNLFERSVALLPTDKRDRLRFLPELAAVLIDAGELARADVVLSETISTAATLGDRRVESRASLEHVRLRIFREPGGALEAAQSDVENIVGTLEELADDLGVARAWNLLGSIQSYLGRLGDAELAWERALAYSRAADSRLEVSFSLASLVDVLDFGPTPVEDAIERCGEFMDIAGGDQKVSASALVARAYLEAMRGGFQKARHDLEFGRDIYVELGLNVMAANCSQNSGLIEMLAGNAAAAEREFRSGYEVLGRMEETGYQSTVAGLLAHALVALDRDDEAEEFVSQARTAAAHDDVSAQTLWRTAAAKILSSREEFEGAERLARQAVAIIEETDLLNYRADALMDLGLVLKRAGRVDEAVEAIRAALDLYKRKGNTVSARSAIVSLDALSQGGAQSTSAP
jgi:class 3 adenylate cyclase/tetratricopeptide (TPR) repeat protein